jgi:hypothetical protein
VRLLLLFLAGFLGLFGRFFLSHGNFLRGVGAQRTNNLPARGNIFAARSARFPRARGIFQRS